MRKLIVLILLMGTVSTGKFEKTCIATIYDIIIIIIIISFYLIYI